MNAVMYTADAPAAWQPTRHSALRSASLMSLAACNETYSLNQRIKVVVQTPQGEVTADVVYYSEWLLINGISRDYSFKGDALTADLGEGRYLFLLGSGATLAENVLPLDGETRWPQAFCAIEEALLHKSREGFIS